MTQYEKLENYQKSSNKNIVPQIYRNHKKKILGIPKGSATSKSTRKKVAKSTIPPHKPDIDLNVQTFRPC